MMDTERGPRERLVLTARAQREIDAAAVEAGVPELDLMESAGRSASDWILDRLRPGRILVLVGAGGNGGDGLVVSRRLEGAGVDVRTVLLTPPDRLSEASSVMLDRLRVAGGRVDLLEELPERDLDIAIDRSDWVVDALFGSGLSRPLTGGAQGLVDRLNHSGARVISLDVPSGLPADSGELIGTAARANITLAMAFLKPSHLLHPASAACGNVAIVSVAYPEDVLSDLDPWGRVPEPAGIAKRLPARPADGHKGTFGRVVIVAGSLEMTGAAILACRGALRAGAGLVFLAAPESLRSTFDVALPEVLFVPLPEAGGHVADIETAELEEVLGRADVLAIGPGMTRAPETSLAIRELVDTFSGPILLDADGIAAFASDLDRLTRLGSRLLLTPHPGELGLLLGRTAEEIDRDRADVVRAFVRERGNVLLLKGRPTVIGAPEGELHLNPTGNTGLATGGSGDVLTGLTAGFVAGGASLEDAAILAAYTHGWAAEVYARERAERSMTPSDLVDLLPSVLREVETWT